MEKSYVYKWYTGTTFNGVLTNVISPFNLNEEINTAGSSIDIELGISLEDASPTLDKEFLVTDDGTFIVTDNSEKIIVNTSTSISGIPALNDRIQVYEFSTDYPDGIVKFNGLVSKWSSDYTNKITKLSVLSYGVELDNQLVQIVANTTLASNTTVDSTITLYSQAYPALNRITQVAQTFTVGTTSEVNGLSIIIGNSGSFSVATTVTIYEGTPSSVGANMGSVSRSLAPQAQASTTFSFSSPITLTASTDYFILITNDTAGISETNTINVSYDSAGGFTGGAMHKYNDSTGWTSTAYDIGFTITTSSGGIGNQFNSEDPTTIATTLIDTYRQLGGTINYRGASSEVRTNLITNPSIETNTSGFTTSGNELAFDGTGDYVSMTYTLPATGTISVIVNILEFKDYNTLWDCSADANKWECWINAAGALNMRTGSSTVIGNAAYTGGKGKWATITMTWTSGGNATAYLNGVAFGTVVATTDASSGTTFYWGGGNAGNTQGNFNMRRGTIWNVALSGDEVLAMYNNSTYPQQGNVTVDHLFDEGIGTSVADSSGNGVTGTITGTATWKIDNQLNTRSTEANNGSYSLKVNNPIMRNLDAELYPTVNVPTTTTARWADGTAAGSTTNDTYGWYNGSVGGFAFGFDTTTYYSGTASLKLSTTAVSSYIQARQSNNGYLGTRNYSTILEPSTSYTFTVRMKTNYVSGDSSHGATLVLILHDSAGTQVTTQSISTVKTTTDWTLYTKTFTTGSTTVMGHFEARIYGHTGTGTLIMDAWFDDITFSKTETLINKGIQYTISGLTNGETYSLSAYIKQLSAGDRIGLLAPTKNFISKVSTTEWQRLAFQFTASASTQKFYIQNYTTGNDFYIDNLLCETGTLQDYFDGNNISTYSSDEDTVYSWNGTENLSTSSKSINTLSSVSTTNTVVSYMFKFNKYLEALNKTAELAPANWWWFIDPATDTYYFRPLATTTDHTFVLGKHLNNIVIDYSLEEVTNVSYLSGGDTGGGTNLLEYYSDAESISQYGTWLRTRSDNRVTSTATANILNESFVNQYKDPRFKTTVSIPATVYDLNTIHIGQVVGFRNFNSLIDSLQLQIMQKKYTGDSLELTLAILPPNITKRVEDIKRNLEKQQTENNPTS